MAQGSTSRNVRVGIFLLVALTALIALVFVLGRQQSLFSRKVHLHAHFLNISGLVVGTPVRLAGIDIGLVEDIAFDKDIKVKHVHVKLGVERQYLSRIRADSIARLASKGLLGDMIVNISVGSAEAPALEDGATLKAQETEGLTEIIASVQDAIGNIKDLSGDLGTVMKRMLTKQVTDDVGKAVHSVTNIVGQVERGTGLVHSLLYGREMVDDTKELLSSARRVSATAERAVGRVDRILAETNVASAAKNITVASKEIADVIGEIKRGKGLVHTLIYEEDRTQLIANLTALSTQLRAISDDLEHGKGTIGALLKDPTIYSDLKIILGNIKRSRLLRTLVRYTAAQDDLEAPPLPK